LTIKSLFHRGTSLSGGAESSANDSIRDSSQIGELGSEFVVQALLLARVSDGED
jgi:hypothetical protein